MFLTMDKNKIYGLIIPVTDGHGKAANFRPTTANVFGDESETDEEEQRTGPVGPFGQTKSSTKLKKQSQIDIDKALMEDPNVYEYDSIYDNMQASKPKVGNVESTKTKKDKKPRYITGLLKAAEVRKKEEEKRKERQVQKEREAEGDKFANKESFVTAAYKKKMLENQEEEERERREANLEALTDVTKQKDMSGFYRYLYRETTGNENEKVDVKNPKKDKDKIGRNIKEEPDKEMAQEPVSPAVRRRSSSASASSSSSSSTEDVQGHRPSSDAPVLFNKVKQSHRHTRKREESNHSSSEIEEKLVRQESRSNKQKARKDPSKKSRFRDTDLTIDERQKRNSRSAKRIRRRRGRSSSSRSSADEYVKSKTSSASMIVRKKQRSMSWSPEYNNGKRSAGRSYEKTSKRHRSRSHERSHKKKRKESASPESSPDHLRTKNDRKQETQGERMGRRESASSSPGMPGSSNRQEEISRKNSQPRVPVSSNRLEHKDGETKNMNPPPDMVSIKKSTKEKAVDPAKKIYPHHNSPEDITKARKRYLLRKIERAQARAS